jgi:hypothetical protein
MRLPRFKSRTSNARPRKSEQIKEMTYELAKQLKAAGFPQLVDKSSGVDKMLGGVPYVPTLSELIEACGEKFGSLESGDGPSESPWTAQGRPNFAGEFPLIFHSSTPEEAVARLWLALAQK